MDARQRPDRLANDAIFKLRCTGRARPVPVFLVITQHQPDKLHPHYQLFVPAAAELNAAARSAGLEATVAPLMATASAGVEGLRRDGLRGISRHTPLGETGMQTVQDAVEGPVTGLVGVTWG